VSCAHGRRSDGSLAPRVFDLLAPSDGQFMVNSLSTCVGRRQGASGDQRRGVSCRGKGRLVIRKGAFCVEDRGVWVTLLTRSERAPPRIQPLPLSLSLSLARSLTHKHTPSLSLSLSLCLSLSVSLPLSLPPSQSFSLSRSISVSRSVTLSPSLSLSLSGYVGLDRARGGGADDEGLVVGLRHVPHLPSMTLFISHRHI